MRSGRTSSLAVGAKSRHPDLDAAVEVRRHPGARRMTLRVSRTRRAVIVTLPVQCALAEADTFLKRNIEWVRERLTSVPPLQPFCDGGELPLRGTAHTISFGRRSRGSARGRSVVQCIPGAPPVLDVGGEAEHGARRLLDWLTAEARADLDGRVRHHAARLGVRPKRIVVRDQSSRWGSCSTTGVLSFSWRLIMAPTEVLDYVAAHEVAHLIEMNHGANFWALVARTMPGHESAKLWLKVCGADLHRYGHTPELQTATA